MIPKLTFLKVEFHVLISEFDHGLYYNHRLDNQDPFEFMRTSLTLNNTYSGACEKKIHNTRTDVLKIMILANNSDFE